MGKTDSLCIVKFTSLEEEEHDLYVTSSGDGTVAHVFKNEIKKQSSGSLSSEVSAQTGDEVYYIGINSFDFRATLGRSHGMPIWAIILIVLAVIVVVGVAIVIFNKYRNKGGDNVR